MQNKFSDDFTDESSDDELLNLISHQKSYKKQSLLLDSQTDNDDITVKAMKNSDKINSSDESDIVIQASHAEIGDSLPDTQSKEELDILSQNNSLSDSLVEMCKNHDKSPTSSSLFDLHCNETILSSSDKKEDNSMCFFSDDSDTPDSLVLQLKHKQKEKQKEKQKQKEETSQPFSLIMYSRRILFTYKSPFINGSVDITEYDRSRLNEGIMINDSIVNYYLMYSLNQAIEDELQLNAIEKEEAVSVIQQQYEGSEERKKLIIETTDRILRRIYIFSTFFFPLLKGLHQTSNTAIKEKVIKWAYDGHIFERQFILFPIYQHSHFSLILLCYPNKLKQYIQKKACVNGINYAYCWKPSNDQATVYGKDDFACLIYLDSLGFEGSEECMKIRSLIRVLLQNEGIADIDITSYNLPQLRISCAHQTNSVDCGIYMITFAKRFLKKLHKLSLRGNCNDQQKVNSCFQMFDLEKVNANHVRKQIIGSIDKQSQSFTQSTMSMENESDSSDLEIVQEEVEKEKENGVILEDGDLLNIIRKNEITKEKEEEKRREGETDKEKQKGTQFEKKWMVERKKRKTEKERQIESKKRQETLFKAKERVWLKQQEKEKEEARKKEEKEEMKRMRMMEKKSPMKEEPEAKRKHLSIEPSYHPSPIKPTPISSPKKPASTQPKDYEFSMKSLFEKAGLNSSNSKLAPLVKETQKRKSMAISNIKQYKGIDTKKKKVVSGYSIRNSL